MDNFRFSFAVFFKLLPKLNDFINYDDCIGKTSSKSIRLYPLIIQNTIEFSKKWIISIEKKRNSFNFNYNFTHSFWKGFLIKPLYWL